MKSISPVNALVLHDVISLTMHQNSLRKLILQDFLVPSARVETIYLRLAVILAH
jgi:hypothetical protein